jgi:hypothetical protein
VSKFYLIIISVCPLYKFKKKHRNEIKPFL